MKVLLFSDLHDSSRGLKTLIDFLNKSKEIGGIVFAGDLINMGQPIKFVEKFISEISQFNVPLLWVPGNNDFGESYKVLQNYTKSLEGRIVKLDGRDFTGVGGSPASWATEYQGENSLSKEQIAGTIFVSHYPPLGVKYTAENPKSEIRNPKKSQNTNDQINSSFGFRASDLQRKIVDLPLVHICGHIHSTQGIGYIGETKVIKLASSALGNIAIMDLENLNVKFMRLI